MGICQSCGEKYYWIIDRDYTAEPGAEVGTNMNARGISGGATRLIDYPVKVTPQRFVMKDDDGISYYAGRLYGGCGFEPLDDYGTPNAGATEIHINGELL